MFGDVRILVDAPTVASEIVATTGAEVAVTVRTAVPITPCDAALIAVVPAAMPATTPEAETVATVVLLDVHVTPELDGGTFDADRVAAGFGEQVLLVGHNPDVAQAVYDLTGARVRMRKGALAGIEDGELLVFLRPGDLAAIAGGG